MKATILVVDDETDNLEIVTDYLTRADAEYKIVQAKNGAIALKIALKIIPDLILTDWNMPIMDGLELTIALKKDETTAEIPVIMQTANSEDRQLELAFASGVMDYIKKPISHLELIARVRSTLELSRAKAETEKLLLNILPKETAEELKATGHASTKRYEHVTVLFTDFKGFTQIAENMEPEEVVQNLDYCFQAFDDICKKHRLEKGKTIGDSYMAAGGIPVPDSDNPIRAVAADLEMKAFMKQWKDEKTARGEQAWEVRIGLHTGPLVAGVVGKDKFAYDVWGDTVNTASRMESSGEAGRVNISAATYSALVEPQGLRFAPEGKNWQFEYRGKINAKNKGEVEMYFVTESL